MTSSPEPPPSRRRLEPDELIAILVAFGSIGAIFFWAIGQNNQGLDFASLASPFQSPSVSPVPLPTVAAPTSEISPPAVAPTASPTIAPEVVVVPPSPGVQVAPVPVPAPKTEPYSASPAPAAVTAFSDVPANYWANPYIAELTQRGVLQGFPDGTFQPNKPITRAEFAGIVSKAFDKSAAKQALPFSDLSSNYWAKGAIDEAVQTGFLNGYPGGVFRPEQTIPLSQLQVALVTGLNLKPSTNSAQALSKYQDAQDVPKWATDKIAAAIEAGLVTEYPDATKLTPNRGATRADAAALIYEALANEGKVNKIQR